MTCETVRQRLLEIDLDEIDSLTPHLARCPDCAALVERIRVAEADLARRQEEFVTKTAALDAQWAEALTQVDDRRRSLSTSLTGAVLVFVALLVAVLATRPPLPPEPGDAPVAASAPVALAGILEEKRAYEAIDMAVPEGIEGRDQDRWLQDALKRKTEGYLAVEAQLMTLAEDDSLAPRWQVEVRLALADVYADMAATLEGSSVPSYLSEEQAAYYRRKVLERSTKQWDNAIEAGEEAATVARAAGLRGLERRVRARIAELEDRRPATGP